MILGITIFLAGFIVDIFWVLYIKHVGINKALLASLYSTAIGLCSIIWVKIIVEDLLYGIIYLLGLFLGTYVTMIFFNNKKIKTKNKKDFTNTRRYKFERFLDRYNHTLEFIRTLGAAATITFLALSYFDMI